MQLKLGENGKSVMQLEVGWEVADVDAAKTCACELRISATSYDSQATKQRAIHFVADHCIVVASYWQTVD